MKPTRIKIIIATEDGEIINSSDIIELDEKTVGITFKESDTTIPKDGRDEILLIPDL